MYTMTLFSREFFLRSGGTTFVFFIPKSNSDKVRPISKTYSMSFCFLKLLEKIINDRLYWWIEHNKLINNSQFGFRMNKSCNDSLAVLISETEIQFYKKSHLTAADIKSAYDNVDPDFDK